MIVTFRLSPKESTILFDLRNLASEAIGDKASISFVLRDMLVTYSEALEKKYKKMREARKS